MCGWSSDGAAVTSPWQLQLQLVRKRSRQPQPATLELCTSAKGSCEHTGASNIKSGEEAEEMLVREHFTASLSEGIPRKDAQCHKTTRKQQQGEKKPPHTTKQSNPKNPHFLEKEFLKCLGNQITTFVSHVSTADDASEQCGMEITANLACNSSQLNCTYCTHSGSTCLSFPFTAV